MIAKLIYDLTDSDDLMAHSRAVNSLDLSLFIWELRHNFLRSALKDGLDPVEMAKLINEKIDSLPFDIDDLVR
jgi:hypothetical protein